MYKRQEWSLLLGGSLEDAATGVAELPGGELFVSGYSYSADGDFPESIKVENFT